jgi:hypothetical protein
MHGAKAAAVRCDMSKPEDVREVFDRTATSPAATPA